LRVLITGGSGFIGSHLCEHFLNQGHEVLCLDNLFSSSKKNIYPFMANPAFEFIRHDITQPIHLEVDWIFNLACPASPLYYQKNPVQTVKTNIMGALHMLGLAKRVNARIFQASTSEVYGDPQEHPQKEDYWGCVNPIGSRSCYDEGKRATETLMMDYHRQNNVDVRIARIFNTYGPRMSINDGRVMSNLIVQALKKEKMTIYGDGKQTRSFCFVSDLISGITKFMDTENLTGPINLGNPEEITILELAERIKRTVGNSIEIEFSPLPEDDPVRRRPCIDLAREKLNWEPEVTLSEGLARTIKYFDSVLD
jgi:UDP-glucuronate decarboxylase